MKKAIVLDFYEHVVNRRDFAGASKHLGATYIQHRADAEDGSGGLQRFIDRMRGQFPGSHCEVLRTFCDGDFVILHAHVRLEPGARGSKHVDIFRMDRDKVVEHWDVDQPIPEHFVNPNGPF
ncbi:MAG TPA: ester cyclase [Kofleriaceae bacterium]